MTNEIRHNTIAISTNEVHLWWAFPEHIRDPTILDRQFSALSAAERERHDRFVFDHHRHQYLVSHALVRDVLSRYAPVAPKDWRFEVNQHGRPSIEEPNAWQWLRFSLSHTDGRTALAVARDIEIGADVEATRRADELAEVAGQFFSPLEVVQLAQYPDSFFDFWTLKEAYIKARGMGLAIPLGSFSFVMKNPADPRIVFHDGCQDRSDRWQFLLRRSDGYCMAVAAATGTTGTLGVIERTVVPMEEARSY